MLIFPMETPQWHAKSKMSQTVEIAKARVTGNTATPGVLRVITPTELAKLRDIAGKHI